MHPFLRYGLPGLAGASAVAAIALSSSMGSGYGLIAWLFAAFFACGAVLARDTRWGVILTAVGCLAANGYLLSRKIEASAEPSLCTISAKLDCDALNTSEYSEVAGIPITLLGVGFYLGLVAAGFVASRKDPRFDQVNTAFAVVALAYSSFLAAVSFSLGVMCVVCTSIYAGNALLLVGGVKGLREAGWRFGQDFGGVPVSSSFLTISAIFLVTVSAGQSTVSRVGAIRGPSTDGVAAEPGEAPPGQVLYAKPLGEVELDGTEPILGDPDAPYLVVEFADFGCPHCAHAEGDLKELVRRHPDVQVRFKAFPLSPSCNPLFGGEDSGERCLAALAAECGGQQGQFWEMAHTLFQNPRSFSPSALMYHAEQLGLDMARFESCVMSQETADGVASDIESGIQAGVSGTPALFLRGAHGSDFVLILYTPAELLQVIEAHKAGEPLPPARPLARGH